MSGRPLWQQPVTYGAIGASQTADLMRYPPEGFRPYVKRVRVGTGEARWDFAWHATLSWGIKIRSGFTIEPTEAPPEVRQGSYTPVSFDTGGLPVAAATSSDAAEDVFGRDGLPLVTPGDSLWIVAHFGPLRFREPVRVLYVVDEPKRKGFGYGTLPGHPLSGEEAFFVEYDDDSSVWLTVRSFSRASNRWWAAAWPALFVARAIVRRRYLHSLSGPVD